MELCALACFIEAGCRHDELRLCSRAAVSSGPFCNDGNVLYQLCEMATTGPLTIEHLKWSYSY